MKIENIIDDIKNDIIDIKNHLEEQFKKENILLNYSLSMPGIDELVTVKSLALLISENSKMFYLSVDIHTHNGNRVFENEPKEIVNNQLVPYKSRHPFQDKFVDLIRGVIKREKNKVKSTKKSRIKSRTIQYYNNDN